MLKDVRHCLDEARALGVELRLGAMAEPLFARVADAGHGDEDFAAVIRAVEAKLHEISLETWAPRS